MNFNLKKHKTAGITYKDDGKIPISKIKDSKIINTNITFKKPFKLQVRASKMIDGKKTIRKKTITYPASVTLLDAIKDAAKNYENMMTDIENNVIVETEEELHAGMKFSDAFAAYVKNKIEEHQYNSVKKPYNQKGAEAFFNKYLRRIHDMTLKQIKPKHLVQLKNNMSGKSDRYKLHVHQYINPVYVFVNDNSNDYVKSPAKIHKKDRNWNNTREFNLSADEIKALFIKLKDYPRSPFREVFMWLMHGRRKNEVLSLQWSDIDLKNNTYTIRAINNKARVNRLISYRNVSEAR